MPSWVDVARQAAMKSVGAWGTPYELSVRDRQAADAVAVAVLAALRQNVHAGDVIDVAYLSDRINSFGQTEGVGR